MLVAAAEAAGVPLLVGHHRRHNPMIQKAKEIVTSGRLGKLVSVHGFFWLMKPDDYFEVAWRRAAGAGPVLTNLIHDIDLLRYLVGEIASVQALASNAVRGFEIEETAAVLLEFTNGVVGTVNVSDTIVAPWSWEQTTGENPVYPQTDQSCYTIGGTHGALTVPKLEVWSNSGTRSWWEPIEAQRIYAALHDPLRLQIQHLCAVVRGESKPLVSGQDGLQTLRVIQAIKAAAVSGTRIAIKALRPLADQDSAAAFAFDDHSLAAAGAADGGKTAGAFAQDSLGVGFHGSHGLVHQRCSDFDLLGCNCR